MIYFAIKIKNQNLFWNSSDVLGDYISESPYLMKTKKEAEEVLNFLDNTYNEITNEEFSADDYELVQVELKF